jgi:predicted RNA-binding protein with PUA-like domain
MESFMAIYCLKCGKELLRVMDMSMHFNTCYADLPADVKIAAKASPKLMSESYFTNQKPAFYDPHAEAKDVIWDAIDNLAVRASVRAELASMLKNSSKLDLFDVRNFTQRLSVSGIQLVATEYYRKMSTAEWNASDGTVNPFDAAFQHSNTANYRYWMSSSLAKVNAFGNENSTDAGGVIVKISFSKALFKEFEIKAHQERNVQANDKVVAIHREGFAELGPIDSDSQVAEIIGVSPALDHNLGFTAKQSIKLNSLRLKFERMP